MGPESMDSSEDYAQLQIRRSVASMLENIGFASAQELALNTLSDMTRRYLQKLWHDAKLYTECAGRSQPIIHDASVILSKQRMDLDEMYDYMKQVAGNPLPEQISLFPQSNGPRLRFYPSRGDTIKELPEYFSSIIQAMQPQCCADSVDKLACVKIEDLPVLATKPKAESAFPEFTGSSATILGFPFKTELEVENTEKVPDGVNEISHDESKTVAVTPSSMAPNSSGSITVFKKRKKIGINEAAMKLMVAQQLSSSEIPSRSTSSMHETEHAAATSLPTSQKVASIDSGKLSHRGMAKIKLKKGRHYKTKHHDGQRIISVIKTSLISANVSAASKGSNYSTKEQSIEETVRSVVEEANRMCKSTSLSPGPGRSDAECKPNAQTRSVVSTSDTFPSNNVVERYSSDVVTSMKQLSETKINALPCVCDSAEKSKLENVRFGSTLMPSLGDGSIKLVLSRTNLSKESVPNPSKGDSTTIILVEHAREETVEKPQLSESADDAILKDKKNRKKKHKEKLEEKAHRHKDKNSIEYRRHKEEKRKKKAEKRKREVEEMAAVQQEKASEDYDAEPLRKIPKLTIKYGASGYLEASQAHEISSTCDMLEVKRVPTISLKMSSVPHNSSSSDFTPNSSETANVISSQNSLDQNESNMSKGDSLNQKAREIPAMDRAHGQQQTSSIACKKNVMKRGGRMSWLTKAELKAMSSKIDAPNEDLIMSGASFSKIAMEQPVKLINEVEKGESTIKHLAITKVEGDKTTEENETKISESTQQQHVQVSQQNSKLNTSADDGNKGSDKKSSPTKKYPKKCIERDAPTCSKNIAKHTKANRGSNSNERLEEISTKSSELKLFREEQIKVRSINAQPKGDNIISLDKTVVKENKQNKSILNETHVKELGPSKRKRKKKDIRDSGEAFYVPVQPSSSNEKSKKESKLSEDCKSKVSKSESLVNTSKERKTKLNEDKSSKIPNKCHKLDSDSTNKLQASVASSSRKVKKFPVSENKDSSRLSQSMPDDQNDNILIQGEELKEETLEVWICPVCSVAYAEGCDMVCCDLCDNWFHWNCVGLVSAPHSELPWYCSSCLRRENLKRKNIPTVSKKGRK